MYDVCKELRVEARRHNRLNRIATEERKEWLMETLEEHRVRGRDKERAKHRKHKIQNNTLYIGSAQRTLLYKP